MKKLTIIKTGGALLEDAEQLQLLIKKTVALPGHKLLVHGGGRSATALGEKLGITAQLINGRRITEAATLEVITMVYAGLINKTVTAQLQAAGCNAIGLCGADGNLLRTRKRENAEVDYGFVGDCFPGSVNEALLLQLLEQNYVPVIAPVTHDGAGQLLNTNADTIAAAIATAMQTHFETTLVYCFEKNGVLKNMHDEHSVIAELSAADFDTLQQQGIISKGMLPKLTNALQAKQAGVQQVYIMHPQFIGGTNADPKTVILN
jgi:acetylglutamate kinase